MPKQFKLSNETNLDGLHRRPLYDELIGEINKPLITHYPDRKATQLRNSNWLQQLDGDDYTALQQMNHNIMKEHEKDILLKHYAQANGIPLQEVKSMHKQAQETTAPPQTQYFDMSAGDEPMPDSHTDATHPTDHPLFGPEIDLTNENLYKTVDRLPMRSKTIHKIQKEPKEPGKPNTRRKEKLAKDEHDDAVAQVAQSDIHDAAIQVSRKAVKKSAFTKLAHEHLGKVNTDVDAKVNKEIAKLNKHEGTDAEILATAKAYDEHQTKQQKPKRNVQEGGSSASTDPPKKAKAEAPRKSSKRKRSKSPEPETLREKNELSKQEMKAIANYDVAVHKGSNLEQFKTANDWKNALGKRKEPYHGQMSLRKLDFNANTTIQQMINAIMTYDKK